MVFVIYIEKALQKTLYKTMDKNIQKGIYGEKIAAKYISKKGFEIMDTNFWRRGGEIDIIAKNNEYIVFIEVKFRSGLKNGYPSEAVNIKKQSHIIQAAKEYILIKNIENMNFRFDVIELLKIGKAIYIKHIENAFWLEEGLS